MFFQMVTLSIPFCLILFSAMICIGSLARAKPPVDVTTGYHKSEPANVSDVGWG